MYATLRRRLDAGDDAQQCALASAIDAHQLNFLTARDLEADTAENKLGAIIFGQPTDTEERHRSSPICKKAVVQLPAPTANISWFVSVFTLSSGKRAHVSYLSLNQRQL